MICSRQVSASLGQTAHWCKAIRLQKSYPGLNLASVCLRQGRNSAFEEGKAEIYSLSRASSSTVVLFFLCVQTSFPARLFLTAICQPSQLKRRELLKALLKRVAESLGKKELSTSELTYI